MSLFNDLWHIGTDMMSWDYKEPADELKEKIIKTFEENKQLQAKVNQLETNRDEAIELVKEIKLHYQQHPTMIPSVKIDKLLSLLERGKE